jgi:hypothetical protein
MTTHKRIKIPVITVYCRDAVHADIPREVVARFGNYPPGVWAEDGWQLLSDFYEESFDDTSTDHRRRFVDEVVIVDRQKRYNLKCPKCYRRGKRRPITVPIRWDKLQLVCDYVTATGESSVWLDEFAATIRRSAGRKL